jgi:hypothetical protein
MHRSTKGDSNKIYFTFFIFILFSTNFGNAYEFSRKFTWISWKKENLGTVLGPHLAQGYPVLARSSIHPGLCVVWRACAPSRSPCQRLTRWLALSTSASTRWWGWCSGTGGVSTGRKWGARRKWWTRWGITEVMWWRSDGGSGRWFFTAAAFRWTSVADGGSYSSSGLRGMTLNRWNGGAHLGGGNDGGGSSKSGRGNGSSTAGSDRRSTRVRWGAVRAFCVRIGTRGKQDDGGNRWPIKGAQRTASWGRNGRGRGSGSWLWVEERRGARCLVRLSEGRGLVEAGASWWDRSTRLGGGEEIGGAWLLWADWSGTVWRHSVVFYLFKIIQMSLNWFGQKIDFPCLKIFK